ncbi:flagellar type III secretion system pore protein FliP [Pelovirga terrestris]|uniref:Flagellar biosynthetic protein FliP n=1 Tax=Pelovirga terrestris TaxID=2771352 RepID=A0A8J6UI97_9BACT|nr:flagellar type III secretion system pore protein FliP [Pelovirga terrestris]MBD1400440.1 flagellar type III secretion system pore protein FliP [Pelovirga terrestris]
MLPALLLPVMAQAQGLPTITLGIGEATEPAQVSTALQILILLTILSVAPSILLMTTAFTRIVIVLSFVRQAMGTQQAPSNQIVVGLALFLTFFIMAPVFTQINDEALQPYLNEEISQDEAIPLALEPMRRFMFSQVGEKDLQLLVDISGSEQPESMEDIGMLTLIPAFMLSELKRAFQMGFLLFVPFLMIDMIVASILMAMGMMMLPPIIVSLPFKILLFVLVDGWSLVIGSLVQSFG